MPTYARYPLTLVRAAGTRVWDDAGRSYLDFAGALGVTAIGHSHPAWVAAVRDQLDTLDMVSNLYGTEPQARLADRLAELMPVPDARVFFCNSGAEANEAAIKLVRKHGLATGKPAIVALEGSFHGRTTATLAATGQPSKREAFEPLVDWFRFVPPGDLPALEAELTADVGAVLLEPVMGEGGVRPLTDDYLRGVRALCDERGALLVVDEVQSGLGAAATGRPWSTPASRPTCSRSRRRSAAACRSARCSPATSSRSRPATTPPRSAAARSPAPARWPCSTRSSVSACSSVRSGSVNYCPEPPSRPRPTARSSSRGAEGACGASSSSARSRTTSCSR
jgi:hypothetical protein